MRPLQYTYILLILFFSSCMAPKRVIYFQDADVRNESMVTDDYELKIKKDDVLSIVVTSKNPELVKVFNSPIVNVSVSGASASGSQKVLSYTVGVDGFINFPVLGKIKVEGMTRKELVEYIETSLIKNDYVKDPIVTVQFLNFKISVLGEVKNPGCYEIESERITILDAISKAGDLTINGKRDKVAVIRETDGKRVVTYHDLRSSDIFESPCFYLQQNDVVYVEPNKAKSSQSGIFSNVSLWISIISVSLSVASVLFLR